MPLTRSMQLASLASSRTWHIARGPLLALALAGTAISHPTQAEGQGPERVLAPASEEQRVNQYNFFWQLNPSVCHLDDGSFGIYWEGPQRGASRLRLRGIHERQFFADGIPKQPQESLVDTRDVYSNISPRAARVAADRTVIAWTEANDSDRPQETLFLRVLDANGSPVIGDFQFGNGVGSDFHENLAALAPDGIAISWTRSVASADTEEASVILVRAFNANGEPTTDEISVTSVPDRAPISSQVAGLKDGSWIVVWNELYLDTQDSDGILMRRFGADGVPLEDARVVNTYTPGPQRYASICSYSDGRFVITWEGRTPDREGWDIFGQQYDAEGAKSGSEFPINSFTAGDQQWSRVVCHPQGRFTVFWTSEGQDGDGAGLFAQHFDWVTGPVGREFRVNTYTKGDQGDTGHAESSDGSGGLVVAWSGNGDQDGDGYGIFSRRYCLADPSNLRCGLTSGQSSIESHAEPAIVDALAALSAAVGVRECLLCECDADSNGSISAADALRILRRAVGLTGVLACPPCCTDPS